MQLTKTERDSFQIHFKLADNNKATVDELNKLEEWQHGITKRLFGTDYEFIILEKAKKIRTMVADRLDKFLNNEEYREMIGFNKLPKLFEAMSIPKTYREEGTEEPLDFTHDNLCKIILEYEEPIDYYTVKEEGYNTGVCDGVNFDPENKSGNITNGKILPYFKSTQKVNLPLENWAKQPILHAISWYHLLRQELVAGYNRDLISLFDERVPQENVIHIPNRTGALEPTLWTQASMKVKGNDRLKGIAIYDINNSWELPYLLLHQNEEYVRESGWFVTPLTPEEMVQIKDQTTVAISNFAPVQNTLELSSINMHVRFFPNDYGYFVPLLLNGKDRFITMNKLTRHEDEWTQNSNICIEVNMVQVGAMQIIGYKNSAMIRSD